jgi:hypothetical protein
MIKLNKKGLNSMFELTLGEAVKKLSAISVALQTKINAVNYMQWNTVKVNGEVPETGVDLAECIAEISVIQADHLNLLKAFNVANTAAGVQLLVEEIKGVQALIKLYERGLAVSATTRRVVKALDREGREIVTITETTPIFAKAALLDALRDLKKQEMILQRKIETNNATIIAIDFDPVNY